MSDPTIQWPNTTHDWASTVDAEHLAHVRQHSRLFAPGGTLHLILEVLAYSADEAERTDSCCVVALHGDDSVSVSDNGRGTDTRYDDCGRPIKKPVMATKDLRFFDVPDVQRLPDGHPRRGMSVVAALSEWLVHTNRRGNGAWTQRYECGIPVTDLTQMDDDKTRGTTVHFLPADALRGAGAVTAAELRGLTVWPQLSVKVVDARHR